MLLQILVEILHSFFYYITPQVRLHAMRHFFVKFGRPIPGCVDGRHTSLASIGITAEI